MSGVSSRRKGVRGEREVARAFELAGFEVRNLEASGDHLLIGRIGRPLHIESKRQERLQLPQWLRQAATEAPAGAVPIVAFRQSRGSWYACLPLADLVGFLQAIEGGRGQP
jgi:Holliday junction resolvase